MTNVKNILVPVDFDDVSAAAMTYARTLARTFGARLHVMHVMDNPFLRPVANDPHAIEAGITRRLSEMLSEEDRVGLHAVAVVRTSDAPADEITDYARTEGIDLIVMGTHGRAVVAHVLIGSVAEKVVRSAPCAVLTMRHTRPERDIAVAG